MHKKQEKIKKKRACHSANTKKARKRASEKTKTNRKEMKIKMIARRASRLFACLCFSFFYYSFFLLLREGLGKKKKKKSQVLNENEE